jgi:cell division protein FtsQ
MADSATCCATPAHVYAWGADASSAIAIKHPEAAGSAPTAPKTVPMASFPRRRMRVVLRIVVSLAVLTTLALWLRTSSLVRVERVTVTGIGGDQGRTIRAALTEAARDMTVLDVREDALLTAVEPYPVVRGVRTRIDFPHRLTIAVDAYEPLAAVQTAGGRLTAVAADGTLLRGTATRGLAIVVGGGGATPGGERVGDEPTLRAIGLLAAAPPALRERVARVYRAQRGLATTMQNGPKLYFGGAGRFGAKWDAAALVLAHGSSRGASYVDLRVPERPVAGGLQPREPQSQPQL